MALGETDAEHLTTLILRIGKTPANLDRSSLSLDVADFLAYYASQSLEQFDLSGALKEMIELIRRYHIMLPARIAMLLKALITLEGTAQLVSPKFSLVEMMQPYRKKMLWRRLSPRRRLRKFRRFLSEMEHLVDYFPRGVIDILEQMQSGKFDMHLDHRGLEPSVNRLVYGMLTSALFLGSSLAAEPQCAAGDEPFAGLQRHLALRISRQRAQHRSWAIVCTGRSTSRAIWIGRRGIDQSQDS